MGATPYPLPRNTRETAILTGDGVSLTFGPFTLGGQALKIFGEEDVEVWTKPAGAAFFALAAVTITKSVGFDFDTFTVTFAAAPAVSTQFVVSVKRLHEREVAVTKGGVIDTNALEQELSKQGTVIEELRRDVGRAARSDFGEAGLLFAPIAEGHFYKRGPVPGNTMIDGGDGDDIINAQANAALAEAARIAAEAAAASVISQISFPTFAALLANITLSYTPGVGLIPVIAGNVITAQGYRYAVAVSGASDQHGVTAGGVKFYVLRVDGPQPASSFGFLGSRLQADTSGIAADTDALQLAASKFSEVIIPDGLQYFDDTLEVDMLAGVGAGRVTGSGTTLAWTANAPTKNALELISGRKKFANLSLFTELATLKDVAVFMASGSNCKALIWIENGTFRPSLENVYASTAYSTEPPSEAVIVFDSGEFNPGGVISKSVGATSRNVVIRGDLTVGGGTAPVPAGLWIKSAIEANFHDWSIFDCQICLQIGHPDPALYDNVNALRFYGFMSECGDRDRCDSSGANVVIYGGDHVVFYAGKFGTAVQTSAGDPAWAAHRSVRFKDNGASTPMGSFEFMECEFIGYNSADYAIEFDPYITTSQIVFDNPYHLNFVKGFISAPFPATPTIRITNIRSRQATFQGDPETAFSARGHISGAQSLTVAAPDLQLTANEMLFERVTFCRGSLTHPGGQPIIVSVAQQDFGLQGTEISLLNAGAATATIPSTNIVRVKPLEERMIVSRGALARASALIGNGVQENHDINVPGLAFGDWIVPAYQSFGGTSFSLSRMVFAAKVKSAGVAQFSFLNKRGAALTLPLGRLHVAKANPRLDIFQVSNVVWALIANNAWGSVNITVTGAIVGGYVYISPLAAFGNYFLDAQITAPNTVTIVAYNQTGAGATPATMDFNIGITHQPIAA